MDFEAKVVIGLMVLVFLFIGLDIISGRSTYAPGIIIEKRIGNIGITDSDQIESVAKTLVGPNYVEWYVNVESAGNIVRLDISRDCWLRLRVGEPITIHWWIGGFTKSEWKSELLPTPPGQTRPGARP